MVKRQAHSQFLRRMSQLGTLTNKQNKKNRKQHSKIGNKTFEIMNNTFTM